MQTTQNNARPEDTTSAECIAISERNLRGSRCRFTLFVGCTAALTNSFSSGTTWPDP